MRRRLAGVTSIGRGYGRAHSQEGNPLDAGYETISPQVRGGVSSMFANVQRLQSAVAIGATTRATRERMRLNVKMIREEADALAKELGE